MSFKSFSIVLAVMSALGITYFAIDILFGLGDLNWVLSTDSKIFFVALAVTLIPLVLAWGGVWWVSKAQSISGYITKLLASSALAWAVLFFGSIYLALLRFQ